MENIDAEIVIIGAGLTGLTLAYFLKQKNRDVKIIEAKDRLGGRIFTKYNEAVAPIEMGATWLGSKHHSLIELLEELEIGIFVQELSDKAIYEPISTSPPQLVQLPPNADPSFRVKGGTSRIINTLAKALDAKQIFMKQKVNTIQESDNGIVVKTGTHQFNANKVISTLPPNLLIHTIDFDPVLPSTLLDIAASTHTWMGESIKVGLTYKEPFWRSENISGTIFSSVGPIPEMYDHSNHQDSLYALKGFLNGSYFSVTKEERLELIMTQLQKYFGEKVKDFISYEEAVWRNEDLTFANYSSHVLPHQNNGHAVYQEPYLNGKLFIAGAETASYSPGYMEGAVRSANHVYRQIMGLV